MSYKPNYWRVSKRVGRGVASSYSGEGCISCFVMLIIAFFVLAAISTLGIVILDVISMILGL